MWYDIDKKGWCKNKMKYVGYHRTSSAEQNLNRGIYEITQYCKDKGITLFKNKVYTDQQTGKHFDRPGYLVVKELLEPGDSLIITEVNRLGRTKADTLKELHYFKENNIHIMILELPTTLVDFNQLGNEMERIVMETINNMLIEIYTTFAEAEMLKREKRQKEGIMAMKERGEWGKYGRPSVMNLDYFSKQYERVLAGEIRPFELKKELNMKTSTFYAYINRYRKKKEACLAQQEKIN